MISIDIFTIDIEDLIREFESYIDFPEIQSLETTNEKNEAADILSKCSAYISYFREMSMFVRVKKRNARVSGTQDEIRELLNLEDVLDTFCKICEQNYEYITKLMTLKRLGLDEAKFLSR